MVKVEEHGLGSFSFLRSCYCFSHPSKAPTLPHAGCMDVTDSLGLHYRHRGGISNPQDTDAWSLMWYNSSCCLWDPRENEGFILRLKSKGPCEKMAWHTKAMLQDGLLIPSPQNGMWEKVSEGYDLSTQPWLINTSGSSTHFLDNSRTMRPVLILPALAPSIGNRYYSGYDKIIKIK